MICWNLWRLCKCVILSSCSGWCRLDILVSKVLSFNLRSGSIVIVVTMTNTQFPMKTSIVDLDEWYTSTLHNNCPEDIAQTYVAKKPVGAASLVTTRSREKNKVYSRAYHKEVCKQLKVCDIDAAQHLGRVAGRAAVKAAGLWARNEPDANITQNTQALKYHSRFVFGAPL